MFLNFEFVFKLLTLLEFASCFHKWNRWSDHSDHKTQSFRELHNMENLFPETNYGHNEFADLQIGRSIFWPQILGSSWPFAEQHGRFFSYHDSWPFAISKLQTLFPDDAGFHYLLSRAVGENTWSLKKYILRIRISTWLRALAYVGRRGVGELGEQVREKIFDTTELDWGCVTLCERQTMANKHVKPAICFKVWMWQISPDPSLLPTSWPVKRAFADAYPQV